MVLVCDHDTNGWPPRGATRNSYPGPTGPGAKRSHGACPRQGPGPHAQSAASRAGDPRQKRVSCVPHAPRKRGAHTEIVSPFLILFIGPVSHLRVALGPRAAAVRARDQIFLLFGPKGQALWRRAPTSRCPRVYRHAVPQASLRLRPAYGRPTGQLICPLCK